MDDKKIVVILPGVNYSADCPLLYYAGFKFEVRGYEKILINYGNLLRRDKQLEECIEDIKNAVLIQLKEIDLSKYTDIVFVSKGVGTVIAGWVEEKLLIRVRHIYLTPINDTLQYIKNDKDIIAVVSGTKDKLLNSDILKEHCKKEDIYLKQFDGVGHRLEVWGEMDKNIEILKEVVAIY